MAKVTSRAAQSGQDVAKLKQSLVAQNAVARDALANLQQKQLEMKQQSAIRQKVVSLSSQIAKDSPGESYPKAMRFTEALVARSESGRGTMGPATARQLSSLVNSMHPHRLPAGERAIFTEQRDLMMKRLDALAKGGLSSSMPNLQHIPASTASAASRPQPAMQRSASEPNLASRPAQPAMTRSASAPNLRSSNAAEGREIANQKMTWAIVMRNDKVGGSRLMLNEMKNALDFPKNGKPLSENQRRHFESMLEKIPYQKMTDTDRANCFDLEAQVRQRMREK
ncbi:hypothetical protein [Martelella sp. HB161492]|uniref:hypothetical protein n=1 Tax=Martelella sp. HB161492 TaxID=2720726 RepID=UPI0015909F64|nr:hypothetical protein [Martelella sp. HB161492]